MKKSVVLTLIAVYVLSVCIVGYFGLHVRIYRPNIPPEQIEITGVRDVDTGEKIEIQVDPNPDAKIKKYIRIKWREGIKLRLQVEISPDETTRRELLFKFGKNGVCEVVSNGGGGITQEIDFAFLKKDSLTITVKSKDAPTVLDKIEINFSR